MGLKDIQAGKKVAKALKARFAKAGTGTDMIEVLFGFQENGVTERLAWQGWLSPNALERTMRTLVEVLGFNGNEANDPETHELTDPKALDWDREVELVVEIEENPNSGKFYPRIKWVNKLGGSAFEGVAPEIVKTGAFKAAFLAAKAGSGGASKKGDYDVNKEDKKLPF